MSEKDKIDHSDIPEVTEEWAAQQNWEYSPAKKQQVTKLTSANEGRSEKP